MFVVRRTRFALQHGISKQERYAINREHDLPMQTGLLDGKDHLEVYAALERINSTLQAKRSKSPSHINGMPLTVTGLQRVVEQ